MKGLYVVLVCTTALVLACSSGSSPSPSVATGAPADIQAYFAALDALFRDNIDLSAADPAADTAEPVRRALERLRDIVPPPAMNDLHERLVGAIEATVGPLEEIQTPRAGATANDASGVTAALQQLLAVCNDLEQAAKDNNVIFTGCTGDTAEPSLECTDYASFPLRDTEPGPPGDIRSLVETRAGRGLPIPRDLPSWVRSAQADRPSFRIRDPERERTPLPDQGGAITFTGEAPGHPEVSLIFGPAEPCADGAYAEQQVTGGTKTATVRFEVDRRTRQQVERLGLSGSFTTSSGGVVVTIDWDRDAVPERSEQAAQVVDWVRRVLAEE